MEKSVKYSTINSYTLSECFINIKSVCVVRGAYNKVSICVRAQGTRLSLTGYGKSTWEYGYFYIPCRTLFRRNHYPVDTIFPE